MCADDAVSQSTFWSMGEKIRCLLEFITVDFTIVISVSSAKSVYSFFCTFLHTEHFGHFFECDTTIVVLIILSKRRRQWYFVRIFILSKETSLTRGTQYDYACANVNIATPIAFINKLYGSIVVQPWHAGTLRIKSTWKPMTT